MTQVTITWTRPMMSRFREAYNEARDARKTEFKFDGHDFLTDYAHYLLEYLTMKFGEKA